MSPQPRTPTFLISIRLPRVAPPGLESFRARYLDESTVWTQQPDCRVSIKPLLYLTTNHKLPFAPAADSIPCDVVAGPNPPIVLIPHGTANDEPFRHQL